MASGFLLLLLLLHCVVASVRNSPSVTVQCTVSSVADCTEAHRSTFNSLINVQSKSLLHGTDAADILHLCNTHTTATQCLHDLRRRCPKLVTRVDDETRKLHNLTRLCHKMTASDLMETYSLHQRCLETKTRKTVDDCWLTFHGDTNGTLSPWAHTYPRSAANVNVNVNVNVNGNSLNAAARSEVRTRKIHLAVCLLHQCLEEALRSKCDDSNTAYEKQAARLVNDLVAPLPPFSMVNINCTVLKNEYESLAGIGGVAAQTRPLSGSSSRSSSVFSVTVIVVTAFALLV